MIRLRWLHLSLLLLLLAPLTARADDPFAGLASTSYDHIRESVTALGTDSVPRAQTVLLALQGGRLYAKRYAQGSSELYIRSGDTFVDARSGAPADVMASGLRAVRVNNPVREAVDTALGMLQLTAASPQARIAAANADYDAHNPAALPALEKALGRETVPNVRRALERARAAALLYSADAPEAARLDAVRAIAAQNDLGARGTLAGLPPQSPAVTAAAQHAVADIDRTLRLWSFAQSVFYGVSLGSVLLLAACGLAITFGVMGVINMAHGEVVMLGAYTTFVVQQLIFSYAPALAGAAVVLAVPVAFVVAGVVGIAIERLLIRHLYGRPLETLLATWGLSLVLQQAVRSIFGPDNRAVSTPGWMSGETHLGGLAITFNRLTIIVFAVLVLAGLMGVLRYTRLGLWMRAVTQNRRMAATMGIRTPWVDALTFGLGSGVAGIAGVALSQIDNVSPNLGQNYIIDSFMVVVFGGVGNLWGLLVSAMTLGIVNKFLEPFAGAVLGKIAVLVLLIFFIQRRPRGMFPQKGRAVEA